MEKMGFASDNHEKARYEDVKTKVTESLKDYFRPEFLNRLDSIILFDVLSPEAIRDIVKVQVAEVKKRLAEKEIELSISDSVLEYLSKEGYNPQYGARPLKRLIQEKILTSIATSMISQGVGKGGAIAVSIKNGEFTFDVKKGKKVAVPKPEIETEKKAEKIS
jgi:ATP-dependent Clp protease ATP-binding subunit ClpA